MSIQGQQQSDYEAILWAWHLIRDHGIPSDDEEYWNALIKAVSEKRNESDSYNELGIAILNLMECRLAKQRRERRTQ